jgi:NitT/TauT family transport system ATP-binding protein/sulfonate transport system ATP-binding protein
VSGGSGELSVHGVSKTYELHGQPLTVLHDIDLHVAPGEFVSIVGASGCGKSTLLRLIVGLDERYEGEIRLDGERIAGTHLDRGIVFQDHRLLPWKTVAENIELALINTTFTPAQRRELVAEHIALVRLDGFEGAYPRQLSGGMAQRAAIARALVNRPKVLLLDEPLGALDALTRLHLQRELQRIWIEHRTTVLMVTHDVEEAVYLADRVVVMEPNPGRIRRIVDVPLRHPRDRDAAVLRRVRDDILADLLAPERPATKEAVVPLRAVR